MKCVAKRYPDEKLCGSEAEYMVRGSSYCESCMLRWCKEMAKSTKEYLDKEKGEGYYEQRIGEEDWRMH